MKRDMQRNSRSEVACAFPQVPLVKGRRCVVLADGFYEWQRRQATNHRQPYFIYFPQVKPEKVAAAACPLWLSGFLDKLTFSLSSFTFTKRLLRFLLAFCN